jgi:hypothetical protein
MKKLLVGALLGVVTTLLVGWGLGYMPKPKVSDRDESEHHSSSLKTDITWFVRLEGYPELVYKDASLVAAITEPDNVRVYRVREQGELKIAEYKLSSEHVASPRDADFYSWIASSPTSMTGISACVFEPGFAIRFERKGRSYFALVCYSCSDVIFLDEAGASVAGWGMTHEAASALIHKFYEVFPDDAEVQEIKF